MQGTISGIRTLFPRSLKPRTVSELPYDVWRLVLEYLPSSQVAAMLSVNRAGFEAAMDERYRNVVFRRDHTSFRYFTRLQ